MTNHTNASRYHARTLRIVCLALLRDYTPIAVCPPWGAQFASCCVDLFTSYNTYDEFSILRMPLLHCTFGRDPMSQVKLETDAKRLPQTRAPT